AIETVRPQKTVKSHHGDPKSPTIVRNHLESPRRRATKGSASLEQISCFDSASPVFCKLPSFNVKARSKHSWAVLGEWSPPACSRCVAFGIASKSHCQHGNKCPFGTLCPALSASAKDRRPFLSFRNYVFEK
ncbi:hypothetical protein WA026_023007, partial [Henosepilachna vigintioctopunctata]